MSSIHNTIIKILYELCKESKTKAGPDSRGGEKAERRQGRGQHKMNIIEEIVRKRRQQIKSRGHEMGVKLPANRVLPLTPFGRDPFIICEIKKSSPSKGVIAGNTDAVSQAKKYANMGIKSVSVLTESNYFSGSLKDLHSVKTAFPGLSILRKDLIFVR